MAKPVGFRKQFLAALTLAGLTIAQWAEREGLSYGHVSMVLNGHRESVSLCSRMREFAQETLRAASGKKAVA